MSDDRGLPILSFETQAGWAEWLIRHGGSSSGVWLKLAKKTAGVPSVGKSDAIETAILHGWIDGRLDRFDDRFWLIRFTPRGPRSNWSQIDRDSATKLIAERRMAPSGLPAVESAKSGGRWDAAHAPHSRAGIPDDFQAALDREPAAREFFATLKGANRYAVLYRIHDAETAGTRVARIDKFVAMLGRHETLNPAKT